MAISYLDILVPSLSGLIGVALGAIINLWAQKKSLRDKEIFKEKKEIYQKIMEDLMEEYKELLNVKLENKNHEIIKKMQRWDRTFNLNLAKAKLFSNNEILMKLNEYSKLISSEDNIDVRIKSNKNLGDELCGLMRRDLNLN